MTADGSRARAWVSRVASSPRVAAGRLAGEDQVAERAKSEDVEQRGRLRRREFRGQVGAGRPLDVRHQRGGAAAEGGVPAVALVRAVPPVVASGRAATCQSAIRSLG